MNISVNVSLLKLYLCLIYQLCEPGVLPSRAVGYSWKLLYSTEKNGFSLNTMYRTLKTVDTPVLLVIRDTQSEVGFSVFQHQDLFTDTVRCVSRHWW